MTFCNESVCGMQLVIKNNQEWDLLGGPVAKDSTFPMQAAWVQSLVKELDPTCCNQDPVLSNK